MEVRRSFTLPAAEGETPRRLKQGEPSIESADWPSGGTAVLPTTRKGGRPGTFGSSSRRSDTPALETAAEVP